MQIRQETSAPVMTRRQRDLERPELDRLPIIELVHNMKAQIIHEISHAHRHNNRLIRRNAPQCPPIEMIEVGMRNEDKINRREMMNFESGLFQPLDHLEPFRPDWIDQDVDLVGLDEKRGVTDPGNADFAFANLRELRSRRTSSAFNEKRRDKNACEKIAFVPVRSRTQPDARGTFYWCAVAGRLPNNVSPALFRKSNWHNAKGYRCAPSK